MQSPEGSRPTLDSQKSEEVQPGKRSRLMKIVPWVATIGWMAVIYCFSERGFSAEATGQFFGGLNVLIRKLGHLTEYAILMDLSYWCGKSAWGRATNKLIVISCWIFTVCYAFTDELHQAHVRGRSATFMDVVIDALGAALGYALLMICMKKFGRKQAKEAGLDL